MTDQQLSFLSAEPAAFDVNAVDDALIRSVPLDGGTVGAALAQRAVDDWVLGLGFTNWKSLIDHALQTSHFELYASEDGWLGLRKHGYRYAPIPRLPAGGSAYVQQRLLVIASARNAALDRQEKMVAANAHFAHKCVIENGYCDLTVKQGVHVIRAGLQVDDLNFDDCPGQSIQLVKQLEHVLLSAGVQNDAHLTSGCKSLAAHIVRLALGVR